MTKPVQARTLKTRAKLIAAAEAVISETGYQGLRVEEVVKRAGVAKGTFFAHFRDKDALMEQLIGTRIATLLDQAASQPPEADLEALIALLLPVLQFMSCERYVLEIVMRYSGVASVDTIGPIALTFGQQLEVLTAWLQHGPYRRDIAPDLLAEGVQAFAMQAMALRFCTLHDSTALETRLRTYLQAWLLPDATVKPGVKSAVKQG